MLRKLKLKFILINMLLVTTVLIITFVGIYITTNNRLVYESNEFLNRIIDHDENMRPPKKDIGGNKPNRENVFPITSVFCVELDNTNSITNIIGENIIISDNNALNKIISVCLDNNNISGIIHSENLRFLKRFTDSGTKIAFADRDNEIKILNSLIRTSIFVGFFSILAFLIISIFLANWALKPVEKSWEQQRQFVADASHELKTPLTVILTNIGIILSHREDTINNQFKWLNYIQTEAQRMTTLINDLLFLAKTDDLKNKLDFKYINFSDIVLECLLTFESIAFEKGKFLESNIEDNIFISGEQNKLKQLIIILLDNACKYSDEETTIKISLLKAQDKVKLLVVNKCKPISVEQIDHIFERFYRVDKARSREHGGYGLGLSIAKSIVDIHGGKITVQCINNEIIFTVIIAISKPIN